MFQHIYGVTAVSVNIGVKYWIFSSLEAFYDTLKGAKIRLRLGCASELGLFWGSSGRSIRSLIGWTGDIAFPSS